MGVLANMSTEDVARTGLVVCYLTERLRNLPCQLEIGMVPANHRHGLRGLRWQTIQTGWDGTMAPDRAPTPKPGSEVGFDRCRLLGGVRGRVRSNYLGRRKVLAKP